MTLSVLFACHAGKGIGLGHYIRTLVAASAINNFPNIEVDLVVIGQDPDSNFSKGLHVEFFPDVDQSNTTLIRILQSKKYEVACFDFYNPIIDENFQVVINEARKQNCKLIAIDKLKNFENKIDLLFIPSFLEPYQFKNLSSNVKVVFGWDCFLLNVDHKKIDRPSSNRILILTGGSDATNLGQIWPAVLNKLLPSGIIVDWVTGPFAHKPEIPRESSVQFIEHKAPAGLTSLMNQSTIASTVYGISFYELIALGIPTVVFSPYEENYKELNQVKELGIALVATDHVEASLMLKDLLDNPPLRRELSEKASQVLQYYSGERFAEEFNLLLSVNS